MFPVRVEFDSDGKGVFKTEWVTSDAHGQSSADITWRDIDGGKVRVVIGSSALDITPTVSGDELDISFDAGVGSETRVYHRVK